MTTIKNLSKWSSALLPAVLVAAGLMGCKDEFTAEDLAKLQDDQRQKTREEAVAALNNNGAFAAALLRVLTADNEPVAGATVTLEAPTGNAERRTQSVTTDEQGTAYFPDVVAGGNIVSVSAEDYLSITGNAQIGSMTYETIDDQIIPIKTTHSGILAILPTGGEKATISGTAEIETDVTNKVPEIPEGAVITAFYNLEVSRSDFNDEGDDGIGFNNFQFNDSRELGRAEVSSEDGTFSMEVPAFGDGITYTLSANDLVADQTIGISAEDNELLTDEDGMRRPVIKQIPTSFGPSVGAEPTRIRRYAGVLISASAPPPAGQGLGLSFTPAGASANFAPVGILANSYIEPNNINNLRLQVTNLGGSYTESPAVSVEDASDDSRSGVLAEAHIALAITGLTAGGNLENFVANAGVDFTLTYDEVFYNSTPQEPTNTDTANVAPAPARTITVTANAAGVITQASVNTAVNAAIRNRQTYFDPISPDAINNWVHNVRFVQARGNADPDDDAILTVSAANGYLHAIRTQRAAGGADRYIDPVINIGGDASIDVLAFRQEYNVTIDNSNNDPEYAVLPEDIAFEVQAFDGSFRTYRSVDEVNAITSGFVSASDLLSFVKVNDDGEVVFDRASRRFRTTSFSISTPRAIITERKAERWDYGFSLDNVAVSVNNTGSITNIDLFGGRTILANGEEFIATRGSGYAAAATFDILPIVEGRGEGAQIEITGRFDPTTGEYSNGRKVTILDGGSGYEKTLNRQTARPFKISGVSDDRSVTVRPGDKVVVTVDYGTGRRTTNAR